jgi:hypothetical protein
MKWAGRTLRGDERKNAGVRKKKCGRLVGHHRPGLPVFIQHAYKRLRGVLPELVVEVPRAECQKLTWIIHNAPARQSETKSIELYIGLGFVCGPKMYFLKPFFFVPGPFQGGHFLGEIIYSSALDLKPAAVPLICGPPKLAPPPPSPHLPRQPLRPSSPHTCMITALPSVYDGHDFGKTSCARYNTGRVLHRLCPSHQHPHQRIFAGSTRHSHQQAQ